MGSRLSGARYGGVATSLAPGCVGTDLVLSGNASAARFLGADGSAAAPTFSYLSDLDCGEFLQAANTVSRAAGGVEVLRSAAALNTALVALRSNGTLTAVGHLLQTGTSSDVETLGTLRIGGDWAITPESVKTASYVLAGNDVLVFMNAAGATNTDMPVTPSTNRLYIIVNIGAGTTTVRRNGKTLAPVDADFNLATGAMCVLQYDGAAYKRIL